MLVDQTLLLRVTFGEGLAQFWLISQAQYWRQFKSHVWHGIFLPVSFLCRLLQCLYSPHVHSYASTSEWTWKSPTPLFGHTKIQHTWRGMGSTALVTAVPYLRKVTWISCKEQWSTLNFKKVDICLTQLSLLFAPLTCSPPPQKKKLNVCLFNMVNFAFCPSGPPPPAQWCGRRWVMSCVVMLFAPLSDPPAPPPAQWCGRCWVMCCHAVCPSVWPPCPSPSPVMWEAQSDSLCHAVCPSPSPVSGRRWMTACVVLLFAPPPSPAPPPALWVGGAEWRLVLSCCFRATWWWWRSPPWFPTWRKQWPPSDRPSSCSRALVLWDQLPVDTRGHMHSSCAFYSLWFYHC